MNQDVDTDGTILAGLVDRVRNLLLGLDRVDRLETASESAGWLQRQTREQVDDIAREMLLRVLRCAGDPVNYRILERLDAQNGVNATDLMPDIDLNRVALSERLNDLAQVGLIARDTIDDQVRETSLSVGVRAVVERIAVEAGGELFDEISR